jgi:hypothetical protein
MWPHRGRLPSGRPWAARLRRAGDVPSGIKKSDARERARQAAWAVGGDAIVWGTGI